MPHSSIRNKENLFRKEILEHNNQNYLGKIIIEQSWFYSLWAIIVLLIIVCILLYIFLGTYTRKTTAQGLLIPAHGVAKLLAPTTGIITDIHVNDGQYVKKDDILFTIRAEQTSIIGDTRTLIENQLESRIQLSQSNLALAESKFYTQNKLLEQRLLFIKDQNEQYNLEIALISKREQIMRDSVNRQKTLLEQGFLSLEQFETMQSQFLELSSIKQNLIRTQKSLDNERLILITQQDTLESQYQQELSDIKNNYSTLQAQLLENKGLLEQVIKAPYDGAITGINEQKGNYVLSTTLLASIIPTGSQLIAYIYIPPTQIGFIEAKQSVSIRYSAYPYQKFGLAKGIVNEISKTPYSSQELPSYITSIFSAGSSSTATNTSTYYRVTVNLEKQFITVYGKKQPLISGMVLEADIIQDKRKIYEWILDPLYTITGKLS